MKHNDCKQRSQAIRVWHTRDQQTKNAINMVKCEDDGFEWMTSLEFIKMYEFDASFANLDDLVEVHDTC